MSIEQMIEQSALQILPGHAGDEGTWPPVNTLESAEALPGFPMESLPPLYRDFAEQVAASYQVPSDLPAVLILGVMALAAAKLWDVRIGDTHKEPSNGYFLPLMEPSERKSPVFKDCLAPVEAYQAKLELDNEPAIRRLKERHEVEKESLAKLRKDIAKCKSEQEREKLTRKAEGMAERLTKVPAMPRLLCGDTTAEKLEWLIATHGGRMAQVDAEGGAFFNLIRGMYAKKGASGNYEVYLRGHGGDDLRIDRLGRESLSVPSPALTLVLTGQPELLSNCAGKQEYRGRGLLGRFLFALPASKVGTRTYQYKPVDPEVKLRYKDAVQTLLKTPRKEEATHLHITADALEAWAAFHNATERDMKPGERLAEIGDWGGKLAGTVARIAAWLHLMAGETGLEISRDTVLAAIKIGEYFTAHAIAAFELLSGHQGCEVERRIVDWIQRHKKTEFTRAELYSDLRNGSGVKASEDLDAPLAELETRNYITTHCLVTPQGRGRPKGPSFLVNPEVLKA